MELEGKHIGFAMTGSFCTFSKVIPVMQELADAGAYIHPIMSRNVYETDTRFGDAADFIKVVEEISGNSVIHTIPEAEPIGPKKLVDLMIVAPCTGCSLAKIANGVTDTPVCMAVKSHLRNARPVLIAVSTNDGLGTSAKNIGELLNYKHFYFVPFGQDDYVKKPNSLVADMSQIVAAAEYALEGRQLQPILC